MGLLNSLHLKLALLVTTAVAAAEAQTKPGCNYTCGNMSIPYPFGTSNNCHIDDSHFINCSTTTNSSSSSAQPIAYLTHGRIKVLNISLDPPELTVSAGVSYHCYDSRYWSNWIRFITRRSSRKQGHALVSGVGCCQTSFPQAIRSYDITLGSYNKYTKVRDFNPCGYAFVAKEGSFNFSYRELLNLSNRTHPMVVDWVVSNQTCLEAKKYARSYACKQNSRCKESLSGIGYYCVCEDGFRGNPYLDTGCKDINECDEDNRCSRSRRCHNVDGNYKCSCPWGYRGDGHKDGSGCKLPIIEISLGISVGLLVIFTLVSTLCWGNKQRALKQFRRQYFEQNGGNYMLQQLHQQQGYIDRTKIFTEDELKIATNNFDESRILGCGGQGTVYKGILPDNSLVAIKKSRVGGDPRQVNDFINEVPVLSQINHRNVVKLFGCCLETEVPLLVYEFVDNGTLLDHIDPQKNENSLSWETRLRIAAETAEAVSYLHSAASIPIIHRDIKSANILLDHSHQAKVSDFGASRLVPLDETQVTTVVQGTLGYLDPEYLLTGQLNEKSDVYSFGVVLVELITGNKANAQQLKEFAFLARRCIRVNGEERPTMKEVATELEGLIAMKKHPWLSGGDMMSEECECLLGHVADGSGNASASTSAAYDSIQKQLAFEIEDGR
ncbi:hypothetical protein K1719_005753 [Acacia pycnantha]|nr:hypothetical protein K1719_005753 [Acacia pycnantha]